MKTINDFMQAPGGRRQVNRKGREAGAEKPEAGNTTK